MLQNTTTVLFIENFDIFYDFRLHEAFNLCNSQVRIKSNSNSNRKLVMFV